MTAQLSRERLEQISDSSSTLITISEAIVMARMLLAGMESEPVITDAMALAFHHAITDGSAGSDDIEEIKTGLRAALANYAAPPAPVAVPDSERVRGDHAKWSQETFGNVGPIGPLKHLSKEALEAAADPGDLSEWADMQFLLWDAQRRAGITDEQITAALEEKLKVNMAREWPEPKDGEPRLHIKAAPEQEV